MTVVLESNRGDCRQAHKTGHEFAASIRRSRWLSVLMLDVEIRGCVFFFFCSCYPDCMILYGWLGGGRLGTILVVLGHASIAVGVDVSTGSSEVLTSIADLHLHIIQKHSAASWDSKVPMHYHTCMRQSLQLSAK